jgi:hypothetical protein
MDGGQLVAGDWQRLGNGAWWRHWSSPELRDSAAPVLGFWWGSCSGRWRNELAATTRRLRPRNVMVVLLVGAPLVTTVKIGSRGALQPSNGARGGLVWCGDGEVVSTIVMAGKSGKEVTWGHYI